MQLSTADIITKLGSILPEVELLGQYQNNRTPIACRCSQCQHEWEARWATLQYRHGCPRCALKKLRNTTANVVSTLSKISPQIEILGEYTDAESPIACRCRACSHEWSPKWFALRRGHGCPKCAKLANGWPQQGTKAYSERLQKMKSISQKKWKDPKYRQNVVSGLTRPRTKSKLRTKLAEQRQNSDFNKAWKIGLKKPRTVAAISKTMKSRWTNPKYRRKRTREARALWQNPRYRQKFILDRATVQRNLKRDGVKLLSEFDGFGWPRKKYPLQCLQCSYEWEATLPTHCPKCKHIYGVTEHKVRQILEQLTGLKWPRAKPSEVPWLHGLHLDGLCRELTSVKFPNGTAFEYQGPQHYGIWAKIPSDTEQEFRARQRRDKRKAIQCWRHGVRLIKIPYWVKNVAEYLSIRL